jgi:hypothetical protein
MSDFESEYTPDALRKVSPALGVAAVLAFFLAVVILAAVAVGALAVVALAVGALAVGARLALCACAPVAGTPNASV